MCLNVSPWRHMCLFCLNVSQCVSLETHVSPLSKCVSMCLLGDTSTSLISLISLISLLLCATLLLMYICATMCHNVAQLSCLDYQKYLLVLSNLNPCSYVNLINFVLHLQQKQTKIYEIIALFTQLPGGTRVSSALLLLLM